MVDDIQKVRETTTKSGDTVQQTTETSNSRDNTEHRTNVVARIIWYVAGVLIVLLGLRFILSLLGANTTNSFADFIYRASHPFVAPFFSLFNYHNYTYGTSHFELYTLVAMLVYGLIAWGLVKLVTLNQD
ncbi:MAG TPA: YggT family protein [Candidatus Saccharimonadales bacterium]